MLPPSHGAFLGRSRHQSCKPWFYPIPQPNKLLQHLVLEKDTTSNKDRTARTHRARRGRRNAFLKLW